MLSRGTYARHAEEGVTPQSSRNGMAGRRGRGDGHSRAHAQVVAKLGADDGRPWRTGETRGATVEPKRTVLAEAVRPRWLARQLGMWSRDGRAVQQNRGSITGPRGHVRGLTRGTERQQRELWCRTCARLQCTLTAGVATMGKREGSAVGMGGAALRGKRRAVL